MKGFLCDVWRGMVAGKQGFRNGLMCGFQLGLGVGMTVGVGIVIIGLQLGGLVLKDAP